MILIFGILFVIVAISPVFSLIALRGAGASTRRRSILVGALIVGLVVDISIIAIIGQHIHSPSDSLISSMLESSRSRVGEARDKSEVAVANADEIANYGDCVAGASDEKEMQDCKKSLSAENRARFDAQEKERVATERPQATKAELDCSQPNTDLDKIACTNPDLRELDQQVHRLDKEKTTPSGRLVQLYSDLATCSDDVRCMKKFYNDEIFRQTH